MWQQLRTVVEERKVEEAVNRFSEKFPRFDEAWEGLKWLLAREGQNLGLWRTEGDTHYRVYVQAGDELAGTPEIWVVYVCTDNEIIILDIEAREADTAH